MALLLSIDTATEIAGVCITRNDLVLAYEQNEDQKMHASFVQSAIANMLAQSGIKLKDLDAVAITEGPGSYTGLRVGFATAKGLCFAMNKPLITVNTLHVMAYASISQLTNSKDDEVETLYCPMIDARRMEVFMAVYDRNMEINIPPAAVILNEPGALDFANGKKVIFSGSGMDKIKNIEFTGIAIFNEKHHSVLHLAKLASEQYTQNNYADLAYSEPFYGKEFYSKSL